MHLLVCFFTVSASHSRVTLHCVSALHHNQHGKDLKANEANSIEDQATYLSLRYQLLYQTNAMTYACYYTVQNCICVVRHFVTS